MIYTTYFAKLKKLPDNIVPISICGKCPDYYNGLEYKKLAPKYWFFVQWKETHDNDFYIKNFYSEVLQKLNAKDVVSELYSMSNGKDIALVCYESPEKFCHRHLVAEWLTYNEFDCNEIQL